jgi:hypothetical protein
VIGERTVEQLGGFTPSVATREVTGDCLSRAPRPSGMIAEQKERLGQTERLVAVGVKFAVVTRQ